MKTSNGIIGRRRHKVGWIIVGIIVCLIAIGVAIGAPKLAKEHQEARNVTLDGADFSNLNDGVYIGEYDGGMYHWRVNKVQVTIVDGKVTDIQIINSTEAGNKQDVLNERVIDQQSLQVDVISGATLTSKAYLKAIEDALIKAQK